MAGVPGHRHPRQAGQGRAAPGLAFCPRRDGGVRHGLPHYSALPSKGTVEGTIQLETSADFKPIGITGVHPMVLPTRFPQVKSLTPMPGSFCHQHKPGASAAEKMPQFWVPLVQGSRPWRSRAASCIMSCACSRAANLRGGWGTAGSRTCLSQPNLILLR